MRTFTCRDEKSDTFWNIDFQGDSFTVVSGQAGSPGQTTTKTCKDEASARQEHDQLIQEKLAEGYVETTPAIPAVATPLAAALEQAIAEDFDDIAAHMACSDYLQEQGDPRGEFIQVQLALEDQSKSPQQRQALQAREAELLEAHQRAWLGNLAPELLDHANLPDWRRQRKLFDRIGWMRGWVHDLFIFQFEVPLARLLIRAPQLRLLQRLHIQHSTYSTDEDPQPEDGIPEGCEYPCLFPLQRAAFLPQLRVFQLGETVNFSRETYNCRANGTGVVELIERMLRIEELYLLAHDVDTQRLFALPNLTHLRVLQVYHVSEYPLEVLATNPALGRLTTLRLHPGHGYPSEPASLARQQVRAVLNSPHLKSLTHLYLHGSDLGDEGCRDIVDSGILHRLKVLDLSHGCIQDEGARILAACPDIRRLELLSLKANELTAAGKEALTRLGIPVHCDSQHTPGENEYLWSGDME
jgi:uncharacterized protein (TIGR02996 family)